MFQSANLVLKHCSISESMTDQTASSAVGSWSNYKQTTRWRVNLRDVIGHDAYDKHEKFCLRLNSLSYNNSGNFSVAGKDESLYARVSGLNWLNSSYDVKTKSNTGGYPATILYMPKNTARTLYYTSNVSNAFFSKTQNDVTIQIELLRTVDDLPPELAATLPHFMYSFQIIPIE